MTICAVLVGLALLVLTTAMVFRPFAQGSRLAEVTPEPNSPLPLELVLTALRDLDFDHQTGKVSEEDYMPTRAELLVKAAQAMAEGSGLSFEDILEEKVKEIRRRLGDGEPAGYCAHCGGRLDPGDQFCPRCGDSQSLGCPSCGRPTKAEARFCVGCGYQLQTEAAA